MINMKNFTPYIPSENIFGEGVLFLKDEQGNDWYTSQKLFETNTIKIAYDSNGVICSIYQDISKIWPINLSVSELKSEDIPKNFAVDGCWIFDENKIKQKPYCQDEEIAKAEYKRAENMSHATAVISPLQDAVDLNIATSIEERKLKDWKNYRILLNRVITTDAPDILWPNFPE